eukprot:6089020-Amphidinium_carterae.1
MTERNNKSNNHQATTTLAYVSYFSSTEQHASRYYILLWIMLSTHPAQKDMPNAYAGLGVKQILCKPKVIKAARSTWAQRNAPTGQAPTPSTHTVIQ